MATRLKILFIAANPPDTYRLAQGEEYRDLDQEIRLAELQNKVKLLKPVLAARPEDLQSALLRHAPAIVHFTAHGTTGGGIALAGPVRQTAPVSGETLVDLFSALDSQTSQVRLVVLSYCGSNQTAKALSQHVDFVVGYPGEPDDRMASIFAKAFYRALGSGLSVDAAHNLGTSELELSQLRGDEAGRQSPVLHCREGQDAKQTRFLDPARPPADRNRDRLIHLMQEDVTQWLQKALGEESVRLTVEMRQVEWVEEQPGIYGREGRQQCDRLLAQEELLDALDKSRGHLFLVGKPGAGKTMALLRLARMALERAKTDAAQPVPVVILSLAHWGSVRSPLPLSDWLAWRIKERQWLTESVAKDWLAEERLLLCLDGFDEIRASHRSLCLGAINEFLKNHVHTRVVVCCRTDEYEALLEADRRFWANVHVRPLADEQVEEFFARAGARLAGLHAAVVRDASLRTLTITPLMLNVLATTYEGTAGPVRPEGAFEPIEHLREQVWGDYVKLMLARRRETPEPYPTERLLKSLCWLARRMNRDSQTVFALDRMPPSWLRAGRDLYTSAVLLPVMLVVAGPPVAMLATGLVPGMRPVRETGFVAPAVVGAVYLALGYLALGPRARSEIIPVDRFKWSFGRALRALVGTAIFFGVSSLLVFHGETSWGAAVGAAVGGAVGVAGALVLIVPPLLRDRSVRRLWSTLFGALGRIFFLGLIGSSLGMMVLTPLINLLTTLGPETLTTLAGAGRTWVVLIFLFGLPVSFYFGFTTQTFDAPLTVNGGIRRSLKNALLTALFPVLLTGALVLADRLFLSGQIFGTDLALAAVLAYLAATLTGLYFGGFAVLKHSVLRLMLAWQGWLPLDAVHLLNQAAQRVLLRRVGGEYYFIHKLLLEHLAARPSEEPPEESSHAISHGALPAARIRVLSPGLLTIALQWILGSLLSALMGILVASWIGLAVQDVLDRPRLGWPLLVAGGAVGTFIQWRRRTFFPWSLVGVGGGLLATLLVAIFPSRTVDEPPWLRVAGQVGGCVGLLAPALVGLFRRWRGRSQGAAPP